MIHLLLFAAMLLLDQITKIIMHGGNVNTPVIKGFLSFRYVENRGAAFSFLDGKSWAQTFFIVLTAVALVAFTLLYMFTNKKKRTLRIALLMIINGALGNFIDRIAFGYVRDFVSFSFFSPVFNIADAILCIGAALIVIHFLFLDKDALFRRKKKSDKCTNKQVCDCNDKADVQPSDLKGQTDKTTDACASVHTDGTDNG